MRNVTKKDMVDQIAGKLHLRAMVVKDVVQCFLDEVINELAQGNRLEFRDFGVFETRQCAARLAQNPRTLERVQIPARRKVRFKAGRVMKQKVEKPAAAK
ncbi:MAG: integration host factor subunit beta [Planctomycetota bacterium]|nr:integration host factor subunit beta [Planctomycetota bacterium]